MKLYKVSLMELPRSRLRNLAELFDVGDDSSLSFQNGDLKDMLQFELQSPMAFDLSGISPEKRNKIKALASAPFVPAYRDERIRQGTLVQPRKPGCTVMWLMSFITRAS